MEEIKIKLLEQSDSEKLLKFEMENRDYFEKTCLPRKESYYNKNNFNKIVSSLIQEQEADLIYMYLIQNINNDIIGRINLVSVTRGPFNKAEIGYRIGEKHRGNGCATKCIKLILEEAKSKHKLHRIEASTLPENIASQKVLLKNGFKCIGKYNKYIFLNGKWNHSVLFEKILG